MPRKARRKDKHLPHHIMSHSIPEINLFNCDQDKDHYLDLIGISAKVHQVDVMAYCLMDNHVHLLIHPNGGDISKFMKAINNPYAHYYNRSNGRKGHVYAGRFKNIVIKDEVQLLRTSTYIHNNPKSLLWKGYRSIEDYPYSSIKDYLKPKQGRGIVNTRRLFDCLSGGNSPKGRNHYRCLIEIQSQDHEAFEREVDKAFNRGAYISDIKAIIRGVDAKRVISVLARLLSETEPELALRKHSRRNKVFRSLVAVCLRMYCDMTMDDLGKGCFAGLTTSAISVISRSGYQYLTDRGDVFLHQLEESLSV